MVINNSSFFWKAIASTKVKKGKYGKQKNLTPRGRGVTNLCAERVLPCRRIAVDQLVLFLYGFDEPGDRHWFITPFSV